MKLETPTRSPHQIIDALRRSALTSFRPLSLGDLMGDLAFLRIRGVRAAWGRDSEATRAYVQGWIDGLTALAGRGVSLAILFLRRQDEVAVYLGTSADAARELGPHLLTALPTQAPEVTQLLAEPVGALGIGTPLPALPPEGMPPDASGRILRALTLAPQGLVGVLALPVDHDRLGQELGRLLVLLGELRADRHAEVLRRDPAGEEADRLLMEAIQLHRQALAEGGWETLFFVAGERLVLAALAAGALADPQAGEPFRFLPCRPGGGPAEGTLLPSGRLATLFSLPRTEATGYRVYPWAEFSVDPPRPDPPSLELGTVIGTGAVEARLRLPIDHLVRHALVAGQSGAGKTNTVMHLLAQLWQDYGIPFLVVEPVKGEYAALSPLEGKERMEGMRVCAFGRPSGPRLNPLAFDPTKVDIHTHVSYLMAVFTAAVGLLPPLPQVLERTIYRAYEQKAWDIGSGTNPRGFSSRAFPTLDHLYEAIEPTVSELGYEARVAQDIVGALRARIGAMRLGSRARCFNGADTFDLDGLLSQPAVIDLSALADDEQIALAMGFIAVRLHQCLSARRLQLGPVSLRHVTVLEEAHRLLSGEARRVAGEEASPRRRAVEMLANMLAEVRAYGEGLVVADQIPSRLDETALKNTDVKIMHRLPSADDREVLGNAMGMDDQQQRAATFLAPGEAVAFFQGLHGPCIIQVPAVKQKLGDSRAEHIGGGLVAAPAGQPVTASWLPSQRRHVAVRLVAACALGERHAIDTEAHALDDIGVLADAAAEHIGHVYNLPFDEEEELKEELHTALAGAEGSAAAALTRLQGRNGPYPGCTGCPAPCRYRWLFPDGPDASLVALARQPAFWEEADAKLAGRTVEAALAAIRALGVGGREAPGAAHCALVQALAASGAPAENQRKAIERLAAHVNGAPA